MIRRNVIRIGSLVALLAATGCDTDDTGGTDEYDGSVVTDGSVADSGGPTVDAGGQSDAAVRLDGGDPSDAGMDGGDSADASVDAAAPDAAMDVDAEVELDAAVDASGPGLDAEVDAEVDASEPDAALPLPGAHYTFDENMGAAAADSADTFADAVLLNGAGWTAGVQGSAVDLAGGAGNELNPHVSLPANILGGCEDATVAMWMKLGSITFWSRLLDIDGKTNGFLYFTPTQWVENVPHLLFNIYYGGADHRVSAPYPEDTELVDTWHHVAFTLSGGTGRLYFDGVQVGQNAMAATPADLTYDSTGHAWLGRTMPVFADPYLDAAIDDVRISCTAYTAEQVSALAVIPGS